MLENYLVRGLIIGIVFGVPVGAVGILSVQRGLSQGPAAGFVTGLGSSAADVFYACVGVFGITMISDFLLAHQHVICMLGCGMVILLGVRCFRKREAENTDAVFKSGRETKPQMAERQGRERWTAESRGRSHQPGTLRYLTSCFLSSFAIAITNPVAILSFMVVFSMFRVGGTESMGQDIQLVLGIFCGTCFWWLLIAVVTNHIRERITDGFYLKLNRVFGVLMVLFGTGIGVRVFMV